MTQGEEVASDDKNEREIQRQRPLGAFLPGADPSNGEQMPCPNCEKMRESIIWILEYQELAPLVESALRNAIETNPEERGETPLFGEV